MLAKATEKLLIKSGNNTILMMQKECIIQMALLLFTLIFQVKFLGRVQDPLALAKLNFE